ncbi:unnamed protein product, partial [Polarella glacialis]
YRADNEKKLTEVANLAVALEKFADNLTVASFDTSENHLPHEHFPRQKHSSDTEWFWVSKHGAMKKLTKPKKDAPVRKVVEFVKAQAISHHAFAAEATVDVVEVMAKFDEAKKANPAPEAPKGSEGMPDLQDLGLDSKDADASGHTAIKHVVGQSGAASGKSEL